MNSNFEFKHLDINFHHLCDLYGKKPINNWNGKKKNTVKDKNIHIE